MKFIAQRMRSATHVVTVGPRPTTHRPWFNPNQPWMNRAAIGLLIVLGVEVFCAIKPVLNNTLAPLQNELERHSQPYTQTIGQNPESSEFLGEHAWKNKDWTKSAEAFSDYAQKTQDLQIASWALRAAALSQNEALIERAGQTYNQILIPLQLGPSAKPWTKLSSIQTHLNELNGSSLNTYASLIQKNPGLSTFLGLSFNDKTLNELLMSNQGETTLKGLENSYQSWLQRMPTLVEKRALEKQSQTFEQQRENQLLEDPSLANPSIPLSSIQSPESIFIQHFQEKGFNPQQIFNLWREKIILGSAESEMFNAHLIQTKDETIALKMRELARVWLSEVKKPEDLKVYYEKWDISHNPNPTLHQFKALMDKASTNDARYLDFLVGGSESMRWMNWPARFDGEIGLELMENENTDVFNHSLDMSGLRKALALYITQLPAIPDSLHSSSHTKTPSSLTLKEAQDDLQKSLQESGLRSLHWPFYIEKTPNNIWKLSQYIHHANQDLQHQTKWSGPVLGLKGRLDLSLSPTVLNHSLGVTVQTDHHPGRLFINIVLSSRFNNWGPLAHEWLHFLDCSTQESPQPSALPFFTSNSDTPSFHLTSSADNASPYSDRLSSDVQPLSLKGLDAQTQNWSRLWQNLRAPNLDNQAVLQEQQGRLFNAFMHHFPRFKLQISQELEAIQSKTWTPDLHQKLWEKAQSMVLTQDLDLFQYFVDQFQTLGEHQALNPSPMYGSSPFMRISVDASTGPYWKRPTEVLARAFNEQLPNQSLTKGQFQLFLGSLVMNPTATEIKAERTSWNTFFASQKSWFQGLPSQFQPLDLSQNIQKKLQEKRGRSRPSRPVFPFF